ncbi:MAG: hypothetical protein MUF64_15215 [Polyangiaceae bacterium]|jgi:hypothetical protein|nr:hypothetical protein [Polyangiaceae bacterium]
MKRIVQQTLALGAALLLGAGAALVLGASSPPGNPLSQLGPEARERRQFEGRPAEQLRAGSYTYVRLVDDAGQGRWVVTMGRGVGGAARVQARTMARVTDFHSRRLARRFDELFFGTLHPLSP